MELFFTFFHEKSAWELGAVFLGLAYLILAMRESLWCWPAALISTAIYTWLFWHVSLLMDSALNIYYMAMAVYGFYLWWQPTGAANQASVKDVPIQTWSGLQHTIAIVGVVVMSLVSGYLLQQNTSAAWPFLDSFTTWASVLTTYMVARKVLENWLYWIVIDTVALGLYIERGLYPTAMLFAVYLVMCVFGFMAWYRRYNAQQQMRQSERDARAADDRVSADGPASHHVAT